MLFPISSKPQAAKPPPTYIYTLPKMRCTQFSLHPVKKSWRSSRKGSDWHSPCIDSREGARTAVGITSFQHSYVPQDHGLKGQALPVFRVQKEFGSHPVYLPQDHSFHFIALRILNRSRNGFDINVQLPP